MLASCTLYSDAGVSPRNLDDEQVRIVAETGGVIGIMFQPNFPTNRFWRYLLDTVIAHIEHCLEVAGEDHVALGSDFDGFITTPESLEDVAGLLTLHSVCLSGVT